MNTRVPKGQVALVLLAVLTLGACASTPTASKSPSRVDVRSANGGLDAIGNVSIGEIAALEPGNALRTVKARVVDEYHSASGRLCRRVTIAERQPRLRLVCQTTAGHWTLSRALLSRRLDPRTTL